MDTMGKTLRILQINSGIGWSGSHHQVYLLSRGLAERGHEVTVVCEPGGHLMEKARAAGLMVAPLRMRGQWDLQAVWRLRRWIKERRIEIVNTHKPLPHTLGVLAAGWTGAIVVATRRVSFPLRRHLFFRWKWDKAVTGLIAVSKGVADSLIASGIPEKKVVTIYSAVDLDRFHPDVSGEALRREFGISSNAPVVGQVADLRPYKGYGVLIEAAALVLKEMPDVHFFCIGHKGTEYEKLYQQTHRLGIAQQVIFTGFRQDVEAFYAMMTLCVNSTTIGEGLPGSLREALAMQVPVVGTDVSGNRELVIPDRTGVLVPPRDPRSLAEAILDLLRDPARRRTMGLEGRRFMEAEFSVRTMVNRTESLYRNLIKDPRFLL
ncbi:MAG: glycosyltransferase [Nitrospirae bacterium]|nr:glycosyltransferase [Nitrospirota bacterium]